MLNKKILLPIRILSTFVVSIFTFTTICQSAPISYQVDVPSSFGKVKERYQPKTNNEQEEQPLVVHIQDSHSNLSAQENIEKILTYISKNYDAKTVALEGTAGHLEVDAYRMFPFEDTKEKVFQKRLREGKVTGAELSIILSNNGTEAYGVEDIELFFENYQEFLKNYEKRPIWLSDLAKIEELFESLKAKHFTGELQAFDLKTTLYHKGELDFFDYLKEISLYQQQIVEQRKPYIYFEALLEAASIAKNYDVELVKKERKELGKKVAKKLKKLGAEEKLLKAVLFGYRSVQKGEQDALEYDLLLRNQARRLGFVEKSYQNLFNDVRYRQLFRRVDFEAFLKELDQLEQDVKFLLATTTEQKAIIRFEKDLNILKKVVELKAGNDDATFLTQNEARYQITKLKSFFQRFGKDTAGVDFDSIVRLVETADRFYQAAKKRDHALVKNTLKLAKEKKASIIPLVAGGFHTEGISEELKKRNIPYIVVTPHLGNLDFILPYESKLTGELFSVAPPSFSKILFVAMKASQLKEGSVTNPAFKRLLVHLNEVVQNAHGETLTQLASSVFSADGEVDLERLQEISANVSQVEGWVQNYEVLKDIDLAVLKSQLTELADLKDNFAANQGEIISLLKQYARLFGMDASEFDQMSEAELLSIMGALQSFFTSYNQYEAQLPELPEENTVVKASNTDNSLSEVAPFSTPTSLPDLSLSEVWASFGIIAAETLSDLIMVGIGVYFVGTFGMGLLAPAIATFLFYRVMLTIFRFAHDVGHNFAAWRHGLPSASEVTNWTGNISFADWMTHLIPFYVLSGSRKDPTVDYRDDAAFLSEKEMEGIRNAGLPMPLFVFFIGFALSTLDLFTLNPFFTIGYMFDIGLLMSLGTITLIGYLSDFFLAKAGPGGLVPVFGCGNVESIASRNQTKVNFEVGNDGFAYIPASDLINGTDFGNGSFRAVNAVPTIVSKKKRENLSLNPNLLLSDLTTHLDRKDNQNLIISREVGSKVTKEDGHSMMKYQVDMESVQEAVERAKRMLPTDEFIDEASIFVPLFENQIDSNPLEVSQIEIAKKLVLFMTMKIVGQIINRGGQSVGFLSEVQKEDPELGELLVDFSRVRHVKQGNLTGLDEQIIAKMEKFIADKTLNELQEISIKLHTRFATTSKTTEEGVHPHFDVFEEKVNYHSYDLQYLVNNEGSIIAEPVAKVQTKPKKLAVRHNGDFDAFKLYPGSDKEYGMKEIEAQLNRILEVNSNQSGDSPFIARVVNFFFSQGSFKASTRLAFHQLFGGEDVVYPSQAILTEIEGQLDEIFAEINHFGDGGLFVLEPGALKDLVAYDLDTLHLTDILAFSRINADVYNRFIENVENLLEGYAQNLGVQKNHLKHYANQMMTNFLTMDLYQATNYFFENAEGSFGVGLDSTLYEGKRIVRASHNQSIGYAIGSFREFVQKLSPQLDKFLDFEGGQTADILLWALASDPNALSVMLDKRDPVLKNIMAYISKETGINLSQDMDSSSPDYHPEVMFSSEVDMDSGLKDIAEVTFHKSTVSQKYYSVRSKEEFPNSKAFYESKRFNILKDSPYFTPSRLIPNDTDDIVKQEFKILPDVMKDVYEDFQEPKSQYDIRINSNQPSNYKSKKNLLRKVEALIDSPSRGKGFDIVIYGTETSKEQGVAFSRMLEQTIGEPFGLNIQVVWSDDVLEKYDTLHQQVHDDTIFLGITAQGENFPTNFATKFAVAENPHNTFIFTSAWKNAATSKVQDFYKSAPFGGQIFSTEVGPLQSEAKVTSAYALSYMFRLLDAYLARELLSSGKLQEAYSNRKAQGEMKSNSLTTLTEDYVDYLDAFNIALKDNIKDMIGSPTAELQGIHHSNHIMEGLRARVMTKSFLYGTVAIVPFLISLGFGSFNFLPSYFVLPFIPEGLMIGAAISFILFFMNALVYDFMGHVAKYILRAIEGRDLRARTDSRGFVIADQQMYVSQKLVFNYRALFAGDHYYINGLTAQMATNDGRLAEWFQRSVRQGTNVHVGYGIYNSSQLIPFQVGGIVDTNTFFKWLHKFLSFIGVSEKWLSKVDAYGAEISHLLHKQTPVIGEKYAEDTEVVRSLDFGLKIDKSLPSRSVAGNHLDHYFAMDRYLHRLVQYYHAADIASRAEVFPVKIFQHKLKHEELSSVKRIYYQALTKMNTFLNNLFFKNYRFKIGKSKGAGVSTTATDKSPDPLIEFISQFPDKGLPIGKEMTPSYDADRPEIPFATVPVPKVQFVGSDQSEIPDLRFQTQLMSNDEKGSVTIVDAASQYDDQLPLRSDDSKRPVRVIEKTSEGIIDIRLAANFVFGLAAFGVFNLALSFGLPFSLGLSVYFALLSDIYFKYFRSAEYQSLSASEKLGKFITNAAFNLIYPFLFLLGQNYEQVVELVSNLQLSSLQPTESDIQIMKMSLFDSFSPLWLIPLAVVGLFTSKKVRSFLPSKRTLITLLLSVIAMLTIAGLTGQLDGIFSNQEEAPQEEKIVNVTSSDESASTVEEMATFSMTNLGGDTAAVVEDLVDLNEESGPMIEPDFDEDNEPSFNGTPSDLGSDLGSDYEEPTDLDSDNPEFTGSSDFESDYEEYTEYDYYNYDGGLDTGDLIEYDSDYDQNHLAKITLPSGDSLDVVLMELNDVSSSYKLVSAFVQDMAKDQTTKSVVEGMKLTLPNGSEVQPFQGWNGNFSTLMTDSLYNSINDAVQGFEGDRDFFEYTSFKGKRGQNLLDKTSGGSVDRQAATEWFWNNLVMEQGVGVVTNANSGGDLAGYYGQDATRLQGSTLAFVPVNDVTLASQPTVSVASFSDVSIGSDSTTVAPQLNIDQKVQEESTKFVIDSLRQQNEVLLDSLNQVQLDTIQPQAIQTQPLDTVDVTTISVSATADVKAGDVASSGVFSSDMTNDMAPGSPSYSKETSMEQYSFAVNTEDWSASVTNAVFRQQVLKHFMVTGDSTYLGTLNENSNLFINLASNNSFLGKNWLGTPYINLERIENLYRTFSVNPTEVMDEGSESVYNEINVGLSGISLYSLDKPYQDASLSTGVNLALGFPGNQIMTDPNFSFLYQTPRVSLGLEGWSEMGFANNANSAFDITTGGFNLKLQNYAQDGVGIAGSMGTSFMTAPSDRTYNWLGQVVFYSKGTPVFQGGYETVKGNWSNRYYAYFPLSRDGLVADLSGRLSTTPWTLWTGVYPVLYQPSGGPAVGFEYQQIDPSYNLLYYHAESEEDLNRADIVFRLMYQNGQLSLRWPEGQNFLRNGVFSIDFANSFPNSIFSGNVGLTLPFKDPFQNIGARASLSASLSSPRVVPASAQTPIINTPTTPQNAGTLSVGGDIVSQSNGSSPDVVAGFGGNGEIQNLLQRMSDLYNYSVSFQNDDVSAQLIAFEWSKRLMSFDPNIQSAINSFSVGQTGSPIDIASGENANFNYKQLSASINSFLGAINFYAEDTWTRNTSFNMSGVQTGIGNEATDVNLEQVTSRYTEMNVQALSALGAQLWLGLAFGDEDVKSATFNSQALMNSFGDFQTFASQFMENGSFKADYTEEEASQILEKLFDISYSYTIPLKQQGSNSNLIPESISLGGLLEAGFTDANGNEFAPSFMFYAAGLGLNFTELFNFMDMKVNANFQTNFADGDANAWIPLKDLHWDMSYNLQFDSDLFKAAFQYDAPGGSVNDLYQMYSAYLMLKTMKVNQNANVSFPLISLGSQNYHLYSSYINAMKDQIPTSDMPFFYIFTKVLPAVNHDLDLGSDLEGLVYTLLPNGDVLRGDHFRVGGVLGTGNNRTYQVVFSSTLPAADQQDQNANHVLNLGTSQPIGSNFNLRVNAGIPLNGSFSTNASVDVGVSYTFQSVPSGSQITIDDIARVNGAFNLDKTNEIPNSDYQPMASNFDAGVESLIDNAYGVDYILSDAVDRPTLKNDLLHLLASSNLYSQGSGFYKIFKFQKQWFMVAMVNSSTGWRMETIQLPGKPKDPETISAVDDLFTNLTGKVNPFRTVQSSDYLSAQIAGYQNMIGAFDFSEGIADVIEQGGNLNPTQVTEITGKIQNMTPGTLQSLGGQLTSIDDSYYADDLGGYIFKSDDLRARMIQLPYLDVNGDSQFLEIWLVRNTSTGRVYVQTFQDASSLDRVKANMSFYESLFGFEKSLSDGADPQTFQFFNEEILVDLFGDSPQSILINTSKGNATIDLAAKTVTFQKRVSQSLIQQMGLQFGNLGRDLVEDEFSLQEKFEKIFTQIFDPEIGVEGFFEFRAEDGENVLHGAVSALILFLGFASSYGKEGEKVALQIIQDQLGHEMLHRDTQPIIDLILSQITDDNQDAFTQMIFDNYDALNRNNVLADHGYLKEQIELETEKGFETALQFFAEYMVESLDNEWGFERSRTFLQQLGDTLGVEGFDQKMIVLESLDLEANKKASERVALRMLDIYQEDGGVRLPFELIQMTRDLGFAKVDFMALPNMDLVRDLFSAISKEKAAEGRTLYLAYDLNAMKEYDLIYDHLMKEGALQESLLERQEHLIAQIKKIEERYAGKFGIDSIQIVPVDLRELGDAKAELSGLFEKGRENVLVLQPMAWEYDFEGGEKPTSFDRKSREVYHYLQEEYTSTSGKLFDRHVIPVTYTAYQDFAKLSEDQVKQIGEQLPLPALMRRVSMNIEHIGNYTFASDAELSAIDFKKVTERFMGQIQDAVTKMKKIGLFEVAA